MITELERRLMDAFDEDAQRAHLVNPEHPDVDLGDGENAPHLQHRSRPWMLVAAATIAVLAIGLAVTINDPASVQNDSIPLTPAPATNPATTSPSAPVDSSLATLPATTTPASTTVSSLSADSSLDSPPITSPGPTVPADVLPLWVELQPGATAALPPAPIPALFGSALVWTGTELIVWGGVEGDQPCCTESHDGAAFDPAEGTWRQIAPSPDGVRAGVVLWTDTEMIVWSAGTPDTVSAAYDPAHDTWRVISDPPVGVSAAFWTGDTALILGNPDSGPGYEYEPSTDEWRRLADGPWSVPAVWTGSTIITVTDTSSDTGTSLSRYDPETDTWEILDALDAPAGSQPVVIGARGSARASVALLPESSETPIDLLDEDGNPIGELAGRPTELASTCEKNPGSCLLSSTHAVWLGGELLFWDRGEGWAFDLESQTWRSLPLDGREPKWDGTEVVAAGELLFVWGAERDGLVYRAATPG